MNPRFSHFRLPVAAGLLALAPALWAGNPQRVGSAAAPELLINPWARSAGWGALNLSLVRGVEASFVNVAGTAFTKGTEFYFSNTQWLSGSEIQINAAGLNQAVGNDGVLGISLVSFDYGEWEITTEALPDGGAGTISPSAITLGISYARKFTNTIYGGVNVKVYNQAINNVSGTALCADAGVQYVLEDVKFGISLKNVGSSYSMGGDGLSVTLPVPQGNYTQSYEQRSATFDLPVQLALGGTYDFHFADDIVRLTPGFSFVSNSFQKDEYVPGLEVSWKEVLMLRGAYVIADNRDDGIRTTALTGLTAGLTFQTKLGDESRFGLDYAYRATNPFSGVHSFGVRLEF